MYGLYYNGVDKFSEEQDNLTLHNTIRSADSFCEHIKFLVSLYVTGCKYLVRGLDQDIKGDSPTFGRFYVPIAHLVNAEDGRGMEYICRVARHVYVHHAEAASPLREVVAGWTAKHLQIQLRTEDREEFVSLTEETPAFAWDVLVAQQEGQNREVGVAAPAGGYAFGGHVMAMDGGTQW